MSTLKELLKDENFAKENSTGSLYMVENASGSAPVFTKVGEYAIKDENHIWIKGYKQIYKEYGSARCLCESRLDPDEIAEALLRSNVESYSGRHIYLFLDLKLKYVTKEYLKEDIVEVWVP